MRKNKRYCPMCKKSEERHECSYGPRIWDLMSIKEDLIYEARKRDKLEAAIFAAALATTVAQSPKELVKFGHIQSPGVAYMDTMMRKRGKATVSGLDNPRVSEPARNRKIKTQPTVRPVFKESIDKNTLMMMIIKKLINEKKRKNYLLNYGYIGESKYDKSNLQCNKPKADPIGDSLTGKSHVVKACDGGTEKLIRFGQRGVKGSPKKKGESKAYASRRHRFQTRHAKNIAKGKMSAAYWANRVKW